METSIDMLDRLPLIKRMRYPRDKRINHEKLD